MDILENQTAIFPKGEKANPDYFTGTTWVKMLAPLHPAFNTTAANVVFERGSRTNWHTHKGGQILICIEGEGYFQEKGKPKQLLHRGDVVQILPDVKHWHGATPHGEFAHIAVNPNAQSGVADWMEPVTDEEYY